MLLADVRQAVVERKQRRKHEGGSGKSKFLLHGFSPLWMEHVAMHVLVFRLGEA
jgi:hypothetical protein